MLAQIAATHAAFQFASEGMHRFRGTNGLFVVDRSAMRSVSSTRNIRYRYQVLNADQSKYKLFRGLAAARKFAAAGIL